MQRDTLVIIGLTLVAAIIGVSLFFYGPGGLANVWSSAGAGDTAAIEVPFTELAQGSQSSVATRVNYLITSASQLGELWKMTDATGTPPAVNFNTHAVIAVFAGQQPTAGYSIEVSKVEDTAVRMVTVTLTKPGDGCILAQTVTAPYELISVPVGTLPPAHEDISTAVDCTI